jgi:hypothetical protein
MLAAVFDIKNAFELTNREESAKAVPFSFRLCVYKVAEVLSC